VSDRDVAFSYRLSVDGQQRVTINREASGFDLPDGSRAWMTPQVPWGEGFMKSKPSYEEDYTLGVPVGEPAERERGQSTHSNKIGLHGGVEWDDLVERWLGRYG